MSTLGITSPQVAVRIGQDADQQHAIAADDTAAAAEEEEEVFYYDERTGAVYDSEGKLVETDADFDAQEVIGDAVKRAPRSSTPKNTVAGGGSRDVAVLPPSRGGAALEPVLEEASLYSVDRRPSEATLASTAAPKPTKPAANGASSAAAAAAATTTAGLEPKAIFHAPSAPASHLQHRKRSSATLRNVVIPQAARETHIEMQPYGRVPAGSADTFFEPGPQPSSMDRHAGPHKPATPAGTTFDGYIEDGFSRSGLDSCFSAKAAYKGASKADYNASRAKRNGAPPIEIGSRGLRLVNLELADPLEDSPFPEVRSSVSCVDDPNMPVSTFRCWLLGLVMCTICGAANTFFNFRFPAPQVAPLVLMLVVYPMGKLTAAILPYRIWKLPKWLGGFEFTLNAGFFNIKEHSTIAQMANVAIGQAYAINAIVVQDSPVFYHNAKPMGFAILFTLSSVCFAFGLAGMCKRFLVWPASMIWPQNLVVCTLLNTLHAEEDSMKKEKRMSRYRYFMIVAVGAFCWNFVPNFLFTALSAFNWVCWIAPTNIYVNTLFGVNNGLGMSVLTFDWVQISYIGAPMITPWWAVCNLMGGFTALVWLVYPILYFSNTWNFGYFPIMGASSYDRFGKRYQLSAVINPATLELDREKYESYSPLYIAVNYYVVYWAGLAMATAMLVHTALYHGKSILKGIRKGKIESDDIHATMMRKYKEVPDWWYLAMLVVSFIAAVIAMEVYKIGLPIWALLIALFLPAIYMLPAGFIFATTGQILNINLITELLSGHLLPNKPLPNMVFKAYALTGINSGLTFVQDLKLGHYMKVPPRVSFAAQVIGTAWLCIVQIGVKQFMFSNVPNLCHPDEPHHFVCPNASTFFNSSLVWGVIGPKRMFGPGTPYASLYYALLLGALVPIPFWYMSKRFPTSQWKFVSFPLIFAGSMYIPPASGINYTSFFLVAFLSREIFSGSRAGCARC